MGMGLTGAEATMLVDQPALQVMFDAVKNASGDAKRASSLVLTQLLGFLKERNLVLHEGPTTAAMVELAGVIKAGTISVNTAKSVLEKMVDTKKSPKQIIQEDGLGQVSDTGAIEKLVQEAIAANPDAIASYKAGKQAALGAIVGAVMKQSKGQANPALFNELLKKLI
jgi:aspartyl-tRNA(Asn)/glutamyl-tRNA(Gln) amidotransferase subunit B